MSKKNTDTGGKTKHSFSIRLKCFQDYVEEIPLTDIAARYDVKLTTLKGWIKTNNWKERKDEIQSRAVGDIEKKYEGIVRRNQLSTLNRKLQLAALIDKSLRDKLLNNDGTLRSQTPENLKHIADAFTKSSSIDAKILGLLSPQNQMNVIIGSGGMLNIGVRGTPLPEPKRSLPSSTIVEVSRPPYEGRPKPLRKEPVPF